MQPHQQRVVDEKRELDAKAEKLIAFINGELFKSLDGEEQRRLSRQWHLMDAYSSVLGERIEAFNANLTQ